MIYLASPYSDQNPVIKLRRFKAACLAAAQMMAEGKHVFSPIAHTHPIAQLGDLPTGWDYWKEFDTKMISICDEIVVLMLDGWEQSEGVSAELKIARELNIPISYRMPKAGG